MKGKLLKTANCSHIVGLETEGDRKLQSWRCWGSLWEWWEWKGSGMNPSEEKLILDVLGINAGKPYWGSLDLLRVGTVMMLVKGCLRSEDQRGGLGK